MHHKQSTISELLWHSDRYCSPVRLMIVSQVFFLYLIYMWHSNCLDKMMKDKRIFISVLLFELTIRLFNWTFFFCLQFCEMEMGSLSPFTSSPDCHSFSLANTVIFHCGIAAIMRIFCCCWNVLHVTLCQIVDFVRFHPPTVNICLLIYLLNCVDFKTERSNWTLKVVRFDRRNDITV